MIQFRQVDESMRFKALFLRSHHLFDASYFKNEPNGDLKKPRSIVDHSKHMQVLAGAH